MCGKGYKKEINENDKNNKNNMSFKNEISNNRDSRGWSFPKADFHQKIKFMVPGPGQYKIPTSFDYISNLTREKGMFDPTYRYV